MTFLNYTYLNVNEYLCTIYISLFQYNKGVPILGMNVVGYVGFKVEREDYMITIPFRVIHLYRYRRYILLIISYIILCTI